MHELAICQALIGEVVRVARAERAIKVSVITIEVGPLSGVEPHLLRQAFPLAKAGTSVAEAELVVVSSDLRVRCTRCGAETIATPNKVVCLACGDWRTQVVSGDQLMLLSVELDRPTPHCSVA